jgi:hypothetical protein
MNRLNRRPNRARPRHVPRLEALEGRDVPSTCVVSSLGDAGVGVTADQGDLRFCLSQSNASPGEDLIVFSVTGTIKLTKALPDITDDLIIAGPGADQLTVNAQQKGRVLTVVAGVTAQVYSVTLAGGLSAAGGGVRNDGALTLGSVVISGNTNANGDGGGVYTTGNLTVVESTITSNTANTQSRAAGGGLYNAGGTVAISGSTISSNGGAVNGGYHSSADGAGVYSTGSLTLDASTVSGNGFTCGDECVLHGAGIANFGTMTIAASEISGNTATYATFGAYGGGLYNAGTLTLASSTVGNNTSQGFGGGVYNAPGAKLAASGGTITGDSAVGYCSEMCNDNGGGIRNEGAMSLSGVTVSGNYVKGQSSEVNHGYGGGLSNSGSLTILGSAVTANWVYVPFPATDTADGAGVFNTGTLLLDSSTVSGNHIDGNPNAGTGGGIESTGGSTLTVVDSTIAGNSTKGFTGGNGSAKGGGVYAPNATVTLRNSTIAGNTCSAKSALGGGLYLGPGATVHDSVVAGNQALTGPDLYGALGSSGYNLFGQSAGGSGYGPTDLLDVDAKLGPLQDNGGPTRTMALLPGSPAIDSGDNTGAPDWDQRGPGFPRIVNGTIDRGAFEVQGTGNSPAGGRSVLATAPRPVTATRGLPLPGPAEVPHGQPVDAPTAAPAAVGKPAAPIPHAGRLTAVVASPDADPVGLGW